ncbi:MAG: PDZ/DHR/GLGF domain-containing protein [Puniceicoccaceae bacterium 5H]|nr:MAG: PDZ/DHR/GLGF domain-containing protein [Puniceicoccaceae bacterium 5H]
MRVKAAYPSSGPDDVPRVLIGTGFFISREGHLLTNATVVQKPERAWIEKDGVSYAADVLGVDETSNLALLKLRSLPPSFNFFHLADTSELPPVGTVLLRISMPLEFGASPSQGMVTGYESRFGQRFFPCKFMRTSLPAGPGEGGAAYLDLSGRLVGMQTFSLPEIGSTYALPARAALRLRDDLLFNGEINYGWIGFEVRVESDRENGARLVIDKIMADTPASGSGLAVDDVLLEIGDYEIHTLDDLRNAMFYTRVGTFTDIKVRRGGAIREFTVQVDKRPKNEPLEVVTRAPRNEGDGTPVQTPQEPPPEAMRLPFDAAEPSYVPSGSN